MQKLATRKEKPIARPFGSFPPTQMLHFLRSL